VVNLGGKKPFVVLVTSNIAELVGFVVPTPTWAFTIEISNDKETKRMEFFFIAVNFDCKIIV
jgi:hypothetical protein